LIGDLLLEGGSLLCPRDGDLCRLIRSRLIPVVIAATSGGD
jgi:hypothetical protein